MLRILLAAGCITVLSGMALAQEPVARHHHGAPAPLLAAGLPAFAALGGGAAALRLIRNRRKSPPAAD